MGTDWVVLALTIAVPVVFIFTARWTGDHSLAPWNPNRERIWTRYPDDPKKLTMTRLRREVSCSWDRLRKRFGWLSA